MSWHDLAFFHWPVPKERLLPLVPTSFGLDLFDGNAYVGVVPFVMSNIGLRRPASLKYRYLPELNVRTYVSVGGRPGVYFFSLDASQPLFVAGGRAGFSLPYYWARFRIDHASGPTDYSCRRVRGAARFHARYRPKDEPFEAKPGTLEYFLTERYCLYCIDHFGRPQRVEIHHGPWPLQHAAVELVENSMTTPLGLEAGQEPPLAHFAQRNDVLVWLPEKIAASKYDF
jgi:hypothetical protein